MKLLSRSEYPHRQLSSRASGENYSRSALLSDALGSRDLFVHHEILAPGTRASAPHRHELSEEMIVVLSGTATLHEGEQRIVARAGDCVLFTPDSGALHFAANKSEGPVELLVISKRVDTGDTNFAGK